MLQVCGNFILPINTNERFQAGRQNSEDKAADQNDANKKHPNPLSKPALSRPLTTFPS